MTMGEYIKQLRIEHGMSMEELGSLVGVQRSAVNKWEHGHVENIKRSNIKRLSEIFGVTPCDLMRWNDDAEEPPKDDPDTAELLDMYLKLDDIDRARVKERITVMLEAAKYQRKEGLERAIS